MTNRDEPGPIATALTEAMRRRDGDIALERAAVEARPEDLIQRARYLGTLLGRRMSSPAADPDLVDEIVSWIDRHPADVPQIEMSLTFLSHAPFDVYQRVRGAWDRALPRHMDDAAVLVAAAKSFSHHESARALELLERASVLDPTDSKAPLAAGQLLWLRAMRSRDGMRFERDPTIAASALRWFELALARAPDVAHRRLFLENVAGAAFACSDFERTTACALELLARPDAPERDWNDGNAIYAGNALLGRVAFARGDREAAKLHLSRAGRTQGSPQLNSFGPDLALANELLEAGESEAVLAFLGDVAKFWAGHRRRLDLWRMRIEKGERPHLSQFGSA